MSSISHSTTILVLRHKCTVGARTEIPTLIIYGFTTISQLASAEIVGRLMTKTLACEL